MNRLIPFLVSIIFLSNSATFGFEKTTQKAPTLNTKKMMPYQKGINLLTAKKLPEAKAFFQWFTKKFPTTGEGWRLLGEVEFQLNNIPQSLWFANKSIQTTPENGLAWELRAKIRQSTLDLIGAESDLSTWALIDPNNATVYTKRAEVRSSLHNLKGRLEDLLHANQLTPDSSYILGHLGLAYYEMRNFKSAVNYFVQLHLLNQNSTYLLNLHAISLCQIGLYEESNIILNRLLKAASKEEKGTIWLAIGKNHYLMGKHQDAEKAVTKGISLTGDTVYGFPYRALARIFLGDYERAITDWESALKIEPTNAGFQKGKNETARILKNARSRTNGNKKNSKNLRKWLPTKEEIKKIKNIPLVEHFFINTIRDFERAAGYLESQLEHSKAADYYNEVLKREPDNLDIYFKRAYNLSLIKPEEKLEAISILNDYLKLVPKNAAAWYYLGAHYNYFAQHEKSLETISKALSLKHKDHNSSYYIARIYRNLNRPQEALKEIESALESDKNNTDFLQEKAYIFYALQEFSKADIVENTIKSLKNEEISKAITSAETYLTNGQYAEARESFAKATELGTDDPWAYEMLGAMLLENGEYLEAFPYLTTAVFYRPDASNTAGLLALTFALNGDPQQSLTELNAIIKKDPAMGILYNWRSLVHWWMDNKIEAKSDCDQAVALDPRATSYGIWDCRFPKPLE